MTGVVKKIGAILGALGLKGEEMVINIHPYVTVGSSVTGNYSPDDYFSFDYLTVKIQPGCLLKFNPYFHPRRVAVNMLDQPCWFTSTGFVPQTPSPLTQDGT